MPLFSNQSPIERDLERIYAELLSGMVGRGEAVKTAKMLLQRAKKAAAAEGTLNRPQKLGDAILASQCSDQAILDLVQLARADGARDNDIRTWWNLHELERRIVVEFDGFVRLGAFMEALKRGCTNDDAGAEVRKSHPMYGDPRDTTHTQADDRPLPYELKDRVNRRAQISSMFINLDGSRLNADARLISQFSTYNAFVRDQVRKGKL